MRYLALLLLLAASTVRAEPLQARSGEECRAFADVAVVARALVEHGVAEGKRVPILTSIYVPQSPRGTGVLGQINHAAGNARLPANEWAVKFGEWCVAHSGAMEGFLGVAL